VPGGFDLKENLCLPLLFSLVFNSAEVWWPLWLRISNTLSATGSFADTVNGCDVRSSLLGKDIALSFKPKSSEDSEDTKFVRSHPAQKSGRDGPVTHPSACHKNFYGYSHGRLEESHRIRGKGLTHLHTSKN